MKKMNIRLNNAESLVGSIDAEDLNFGEMAFQCPQCNKVYYVTHGHQFSCNRYNHVFSGTKISDDGCGYAGTFNVIAYNFKDKNAK
jgi:hypothetical protein